jgi:hypothetical protein
VAAVQAAQQRVLNEVETAHATKHAALASLDRDARAHQTQLTAVATRATEAQRQPNLQVWHILLLLLPSYIVCVFPLFVCLFIIFFCFFFCLFVCLFVCLFICLFVLLFLLFIFVCIKMPLDCL